MKILTDKAFEKKTYKKAFELFKNITKKPTQQESVWDRILTEQIDRTKNDIDDWRRAQEAAEDDINPDREELLTLYKDIIDDYQVWSVMQQRITKAISGGFQIIDEDGEEDEEETRKFLDPKGNPLPWFRELMKIIMLSKFYGYEVGNLGVVVDNIFKDVHRIPQINLVPIFRSILEDSEAGITEKNMIPVDQEPQATWLIEAGSQTDLGLLNKIAPLYIYKKVFGSWSQHAGIFGMPLRIGRTDLRDNTRRQNMLTWLDTMGKASYGVFDPEDAIEFIEQKGSNDPHNIYGMLIEKCDQGISKIVLSQTGTTDEKSFAGSAGVHSSVLDDLIKSDKLDIAAIVNEQLIPKMKKIGIISESKKVMGVWDFSEKMSIKDWVESISKLSLSYNISPDEVKKRTSIEVEEKPEAEPPETLPENKMTTIINKTNDYYKSWLDQSQK